MKKPVIFLIFILVIVFWGTNIYIALNYFDTWDQRGQSGDLFGAVNSLFSGLAFASLIIAIVLQSKELSLQREELKLQREEMMKSRKELAEQAKLQEYQLITTITELKMKTLEAEIASVEMNSKRWTDAGKAHNATPQLDAIKERMDLLIQELENDIQI